MKFLTEPTKIWKKVFDSQILRPKECSEREECFPCGILLGANAAGICAGLMPWRNDLDVVILCIFSEDMDSKIQAQRFSLAPDEAIEIIRALSKTLDECFSLHQPYQKLKSQNRRIFQQRRRRYSKRAMTEVTK